MLRVFIRPNAQDAQQTYPCHALADVTNAWVKTQTHARKCKRRILRARYKRFKYRVSCILIMIHYRRTSNGVHIIGLMKQTIIKLTAPCKSALTPTSERPLRDTRRTERSCGNRHASFIGSTHILIHILRGERGAISSKDTRSAISGISCLVIFYVSRRT